MISACSVPLRAEARRAFRRLPCANPTRIVISKLNRPFSSTVPRPSDLSTRGIIVQTLSSVGSKREVQQYLSLFTSVSSQRFAVIKVGGAILTDYLDELCSSLAFLYAVGLYPIIVHGAGPQLNNLLEQAGIEPQFEEGIRVTDAKTLRIARNLFLKENQNLIDRLEERGVHAQGISLGVFKAEFLDKEKWGYVGKVTSVAKKVIEGSINKLSSDTFLSLYPIPQSINGSPFFLSIYSFTGAQ